MRCLCLLCHDTNNNNKPPFSPQPFHPLLGLGGTTLAVNYSLLLITPSPHVQHGWTQTMQHPLSRGWCWLTAGHHLPFRGSPGPPQPFLGWVELPRTIPDPINQSLLIAVHSRDGPGRGVHRQCCSHVSPHSRKRQQELWFQLLASLGVCRVAPRGIPVLHNGNIELSVLPCHRGHFISYKTCGAGIQRGKGSCSPHARGVSGQQGSGWEPGFGQEQNCPSLTAVFTNRIRAASRTNVPCLGFEFPP